LTRLGAGAATVGALTAAGGLLARWAALAVVGWGLLILVVGSAVYVLRRPRLSLERAIQPPRVEKGMPAIAVVPVTNLSRRVLRPLLIEQRVGETLAQGYLPRLKKHEQALRTYRLPTSRRGLYDIGPVELPRADPFGICRSVQSIGDTQRIEVHPRLLRLRALPTGVSRNVEGPSSDTAPQGSIAFHRLREYAVGDDLRMIHWPSTAKLGQVVVRHHIDTAQPYTVVLAALDPKGYSEDTFEEAMDVTASLVVSMAEGKAPVQLRLTNGERLGGYSQRDPAPLVDRLTRVRPDPVGSLRAQLTLLRRDRGGTALVVITGGLDAEVLPLAAALRRRFDRIIVASMVEQRSQVPTHPGLTIVAASTETSWPSSGTGDWPDEQARGAARLVVDGSSDPLPSGRGQFCRRGTLAGRLSRPRRS
jgi:uncharacterized protein (DUF58 family)